MGHVGDHRQVVVAGDHAPLRQPMRGGFEHTVRHTGSHHLRQVCLDIGRVGRGHVEAGIELLVANQRVDGADHAGANARLGQQVMDQHRGGGFAVGAGDADHAQLSRGKTLETRRQVRQGEVQVSLQANIRDGKPIGLGAVAQDDARAVGNCRRNIFEAVAALTFDGDESIALADVTRVAGDAGDHHWRDEVQRGQW